MRKTLSALVLAGLLLAVAPMAPTQAASAPVEDMVIWLNSDGAWGVVPAIQAGNLDGFNACNGVSPGSNSCTLVDSASSFWTVGWTLPTQFVGSTDVVMTSSNGGNVHFGCNWAWGAPGVPPQVRCALLAFQGNTFGVLTANFHSGAYDVCYLNAAFPCAGTNAVEAAVGDWHAILSTA